MRHKSFRVSLQNRQEILCILLNWIKRRKIVFNCRISTFQRVCTLTLRASLIQLISYHSDRYFSRGRVLHQSAVLLVVEQACRGLIQLHLLIAGHDLAQGASRANYFSVFRINRFRRGSFLVILEPSDTLTSILTSRGVNSKECRDWKFQVYRQTVCKHEINHHARCKTWMRKEKEEDKQLDIQLKQMIHAFYEWILSGKRKSLHLSWRSFIVQDTSFI